MQTQAKVLLDDDVTGRKRWCALYIYWYIDIPYIWYTINMYTYIYIYIVYQIQISIDFLFESVYVCTHVYVCVNKYAVEDRGQLRYPFQGRHICPLRTGLECTN